MPRKKNHEQAAEPSGGLAAAQTIALDDQSPGVARTFEADHREVELAAGLTLVSPREGPLTLPTPHRVVAVLHGDGGWEIVDPPRLAGCRLHFGSLA